MPLERVSKPFKDISFSLTTNPLTRDIIDIKNEVAISRSVRNLVLTSQGERFFDHTIGSKIYKSLFENIDENTASIIATEIRNTIDNYEPRVKLNNVVVDPDYDNLTFNVSIYYDIVGIDALPQQLTFALLPTR
jgi:phage baseplate assembly protein W